MPIGAQNGVERHIWIIKLINMIDDTFVRRVSLNLGGIELAITALLRDKNTCSVNHCATLLLIPQQSS